MEAAVLKKKKTTISKGKIKKTIKNVICRPDPIYWPATSEEEGKELESILKKYQIDIPQFKKPHWNELKDIPKNERPKPPPIKKVEGLIFGLSECRNLLESKKLSALILESGINPKAIVHPLLEFCNNIKVPVICLAGLKETSVAIFGISTSCLGVKSEFLTDLTHKIYQMSKRHKPNNNELLHLSQTIDNSDRMNTDDSKDVNMKNEKVASIEPSNIPCYPYLYRTNKTRVFIPNKVEKISAISKQFIGQDFIELSTKLENVKESKACMKMVVKRISNNANRVKIK